MSQQQKTGYLRQLGKNRYDINEYDTKYVDDEGNDTDANFDNDILKAMNNDYSFRDAQKYGQEAGMKGFDGSGKGFTNTNDAYNTHRAIVRHGTEEMDHKNVTSDQDYANISHDLFNRSRDKFAEQFATQDDLQKRQDAQKVAKTKLDEGPVELSSRAQAAVDAGGDYAFKPVDRGLGNPNVAYDPNGGIASKKAGAFMNQYKNDFKNRF
jgi:hypothetical protein